MFKDLLKDKNITMYALAKITGLGQGTIHEIVTGKRRNIELETASKIANALDTSIDYINQCIKGEDKNAI